MYRRYKNIITIWDRIRVFRSLSLFTAASFAGANCQVHSDQLIRTAKSVQYPKCWGDPHLINCRPITY